MSPVLEVDVAGFAAWNRQDASRPQPAILPPNERRRAPDTVAVALEVGQAACLHAGRDPALLTAVFASTYGDMAITDYLCSTLAKAPATLSPTRFHNAVHNAAAGYWSIATGCRRPYCALGAGPYTFATGLLVAALQACADGTDVLYVAYDIDARGPLVQLVDSQGILGVALVLTAPQAGQPPGCHRRLALRLTDTGAGPVAADPARPGQGNAMSTCLPLLAALAHGAAAPLSLPVGPDSWLSVQVQ
jgi:hypothetical protein